MYLLLWVILFYFILFLFSNNRLVFIETGLLSSGSTKMTSTGGEFISNTCILTSSLHQFRIASRLGKFKCQFPPKKWTLLEFPYFSIERAFPSLRNNLDATLQNDINRFMEDLCGDLVCNICILLWHLYMTSVCTCEIVVYWSRHQKCLNI